MLDEESLMFFVSKQLWCVLNIRKKSAPIKVYWICFDLIYLYNTHLFQFINCVVIKKIYLLTTRASTQSNILLWGHYKNAFTPPKALCYQQCCITNQFSSLSLLRIDSMGHSTQNNILRLILATKYLLLLSLTISIMP